MVRPVLKKEGVAGDFTMSPDVILKSPFRHSLPFFESGVLG